MYRTYRASYRRFRISNQEWDVDSISNYTQFETNIDEDKSVLTLCNHRMYVIVDRAKDITELVYVTDDDQESMIIGNAHTYEEIAMNKHAIKRSENGFTRFVFYETDANNYLYMNVFNRFVQIETMGNLEWYVWDK